MRIVYQSFCGRFSDSPRVLFETLANDEGLHHTWLVDPQHAAAFPGTVTTVDIRSAEAVTALESADLLIANTHTEVEWNKSPTATYLQTWHGTPLKRIHRDVLWAPDGRLDELDRDVARWDLLLSPNAASTPRLRRAFRFGGEILETGYPRNDLLSLTDRDDLRAEVRAGLDIADDLTVVLYAPTWRDDETLRDSSSPLNFAVDLAAVTRALGSGYRILFRSHNMVTGRLVPPAMPGVVDVSYYPDIRHLYLAADVLVTDYSSTMFDFAVTGRPIVFYAYDLERFTSAVRGLYFDFVPEAPGLVVETASDLIDALAAGPALHERYVDRYARFRATYCSLEDGNATDRVLRHLQLRP